MFGIRLSSLFRSRWMALAWAVLICLSAVQFVAGREDGAGETALDAQAAEGIRDAVEAMP